MVSTQGWFGFPVHALAFITKVLASDVASTVDTELGASLEQEEMVNKSTDRKVINLIG